MDYFDEARTVPLHPRQRKIYQIRDGQVQSLDLIDLKNATKPQQRTPVQQEPAKRPKLFAIEKAPALDKSVQTSLWTYEKSAEHVRITKSPKYQVFSITQPEIVYYIDSADSEEEEYKPVSPAPLMKPRHHPQNLSISHEVKLDILPNIRKMPGRDEQSQTEIYRQKYGIDKSIPPNKHFHPSPAPVAPPQPPPPHRSPSPSASEPLQIMRPIMIRNRRVEPMWNKDENLYSMDSINKSMGRYRHSSYY